MSISELLSRIPEHVKAKLTPGYILMSVHGIELGKSRCINCKKVLTHSPKSRCENCHRPWPRICWIDGCRNDIMVEKHVNSKGHVEWYEAGGHCGCAYQGSAEASRVAAETKWEEMYRDEPRVVAAVKDLYLGEPSRQRAAAAIKEWYREGKAFSEWKPLYVHGSSGSGKSVMVANAVRHALVSGVFKRPVIIRESQLKSRASKYAGNEEGYSRKWKELHDSDVLVIDGWDQNRASRAPMRGTVGHVPGYTATQFSQIGGLLRYRMENSRKATIFISLLPPAIADFGEDVASRWGRGNYVAHVGPVDFRRVTRGGSKDE